jgi:glycosyltransferase involved in cell wall biosynthesis
MPRQKITALIPTFNEEKNIRDCIQSVKWADEIFIVDSHSTDRTLEIARQFTNRIVQHQYVNSAAQKNWAIPQASHSWVLIVDADERVTPALKNEILQILRSNNNADGYYIFRKNHFMGKPINFCGWQRDKVLRLFKRDLGRYQQRHVHADVIINGKTDTLKNKLLHYTFNTFDQYMKKFDRYTSWAADDRAKKTPLVKWHHITLRPAWRFFRQYFLQLGFLDGLAGLIICSLSAYSVFLKYAKLWELHQKNKTKS